MRVLYDNPFLAARTGAYLHAHAFLEAARSLGAEIDTWPPVDGSFDGARAGGVPQSRLRRLLPLATLEALGAVRAGMRDGRGLPGRVSAARRCDVVLARTTSFGVAAPLAASLARVPLVLEVNAPLAVETARTRDGSPGRLRLAMERGLWRAAARIVTVSRVLREIVAEAGVSADRIDVVPNGVDPDRFAPAGGTGATRARIGLGAGDFVVCFSGSLMPWHGTDVLLDATGIAVRGLPELRVIFVGGTPDRRLRRRAEALGIAAHVRWLGNRPHGELPALIEAADVCVAPYPPLSRFYFSPIKLYEYMAMARPVVGSRQGQVEELLADGRGVLVAPGDPAALARALVELAADPEARRDIGERARDFVVAGYTWRHNAERVLAACRRALDATAGVRS